MTAAPVVAYAEPAQFGRRRSGRPYPEDRPVPPAPEDLVAVLRPVVAASAPAVADRIPPVPAAMLGRVGTPEPPDGMWLSGSGAERLLGALELTLADLPVAVPALLSERLRIDVPDGSMFATSGMVGEPETESSVRMVDQFAPGARDLVAGLVLALLRDDAPAASSGPDAGAADPEAVISGLAAARGRGVLAVAVVTALAVLRAVAHPMVGAGAPAVVGVALDATVRVLPGRPLPPEYGEAVTALRRARFLLPRNSGGSVTVAGYRFALVEGGFPAEAAEPANGLAMAVPGGLVVRTGTETGPVPVRLHVMTGPPGDPDLDMWHDIVEVSYESREGWASVIGPSGTGDEMLREQTAPRPGPVRARVSAHGRDGASEHYEILVWDAPLAPPTIVKATDALGHRLRGEPEPAARVQPETAFRWVDASVLSVAATVTVATGVTSAQLLEAFGADPERPEPLRRLDEEVAADYRTDPWVAVLPVRDAVLAVEFNGWQGSLAPVLWRASAAGRAGSMYWNVNAVTRLSLARDGTVLASFEPPPHEPVADGEARAVLDGLGLDDYHDRTAKGLAAVARFTGYSVTPEDVERIIAADIAYRIVPWLPEHYAEERLPDGSRRWPGYGPLDSDTDAFARLPDGELRDLAWWAAEAAAERAGRDRDPAVRATLDARGLTPAAERAARESGLIRGSHHQMWLALHEATNPDPLGAAIRTVDQARWVFGPDAADFLDRVRARVLS